MQTDMTGMFIKRNTVAKKDRWILPIAEEWHGHIVGEVVGWFGKDEEDFEEIARKRDFVRLQVVGMTKRDRVLFAQAVRTLLRHDFLEWADRAGEMMAVAQVLQQTGDETRLQALREQMREHDKERPPRVSMSLLRLDMGQERAKS